MHMTHEYGHQQTICALFGDALFVEDLKIQNTV